MAFVPKEKIFSGKWFRSFGLITAGALTIALGYVLFITPYKIVPGGVYGISIIIHHVFGLPVGTVALFFNVPITLLGLKILGPRFGAKTITGFLLTSAFMDALSYLLGEDPLNLSDELLMSSVYGGVVIGVGVALLFKAKATCGGTDMVAMMLSKLTKRPVGQLMIFVDSAIVLLGFIVFRDWRIPLYSWVTIVVLGKTVDLVMDGFNYDKCLMIVSDEHQRIRDIIINDLNRGGTLLQGNGMYNSREKQIIFTVMNRREVAILKSHIRRIDPGAFITVMEGSEILGKGFRSLNDKIDD
ncbi:MAG TPA: YitT family protein [Bacteroidales bacterium]|nr:MAG: hypothetical protein A2X11_07060 [Bacteroidetes bacterium GWE2_42_24]OFY25937.1 MAG: hypothetical protein A2X09_04535 [Bacteroidetes bacterium GWF2_43_11]PKP23910.1 MAG: YitT family protein [Bacteroidetes bacterium HGW-Bacteroidetes-22]HBZ66655.1 YitT family protein [Bacteroidales bacterium]